MRNGDALVVATLWEFAAAVLEPLVLLLRLRGGGVRFEFGGTLPIDTGVSIGECGVGTVAAGVISSFDGTTLVVPPDFNIGVSVLDMAGSGAVSIVVSNDLGRFRRRFAAE